MRNKSHEFGHDHGQPLPTSPRGHQMAMAFGLRFDDVSARCQANSRTVPLPTPGQILFLNGASGSGKSSLLRALARRARSAHTILNLRTMRLPDSPVIDLFDDETFPPTLRRLSSVGLAEVWTWLRRPNQLSEGQRWRLRLALALARAEKASKPVVLVCDEFGAVLDRVSARIVAACVRRAVDERAHTLSALLATSHDDLSDVLDPEVRIDCDFGLHRLTHNPRRTHHNRGKR